MARKKTHEEFVAEVKALVGEEYTVVGDYISSKSKLLFKHNVCGDIFETTRSRFVIQGCRCPKCRIKSIAEKQTKTSTQFLEEVYSLVKNEYTVVGEYVNSKSKIEIKHNTCGTVYRTMPASFLRGSRCPECSRKKAAEKAAVINKGRGHISRNQLDILVKQISDNTYEALSDYTQANIPIKLKHIDCGHEYTTLFYRFKSGRRCPTCARAFGRKSKTTEQFSREMRVLVGGEYVLESPYTGALSEIQIKHTTCGNIFKTRPNSFLSGNRCPMCAESKGEREIREWLIYKNINYIPQYQIKYNSELPPLRLDFYISGIAVEYDGRQHFEPVDYFGGEESFHDTQRRDRIKDKYCADNGIPLIRIPYWDFDNIDAILTEKLLPLLEKRAI